MNQTKITVIRTYPNMTTPRSCEVGPAPLRLGDIKEAVRDRLQITTDLVAFVNGTQVTDASTIEGGAVVEFRVPIGQKN